MTSAQRLVAKIANDAWPVMKVSKLEDVIDINNQVHTGIIRRKHERRSMVVNSETGCHPTTILGGSRYVPCRVVASKSDDSEI